MKLPTWAEVTANAGDGVDGTAANTQAAPGPLLSPDPPMIAVLPFADRATDQPCVAEPTAPVPTSLLPCWLQTPLVRVKIQAAPALLLSAHPPSMAVLPSPHRATEKPCSAAQHDAFPKPVPINGLPCWFQTPLVRVKIQTAPSLGPPMIAVFPSPESATALPCSGSPPPEPTNLLPCWLQTPLVRVKIQIGRAHV